MTLSIPIITLLSILLSHWLADFVCQTDWQAKNKSSDNKALLQHTVTYSCLMFLVCGILGVFSSGIFGIAISWTLINFVLHTATDYVTSRITKKLHAQGKIHEFFVVVGFDQLLHYCALILTFVWMF